MTQALLALSSEEFESLPAHFRLAERDVQLVVDSAVDVNNQPRSTSRPSSSSGG